MLIQRSRLLPCVFASLLIAGSAKAQTGTVPSDPGSIPAADLKNLETARLLVKSGSLNLALDFLQRNPPRAGSSAALEAWAEQKWSLLILLREWYALKQDAHGLPASFGAEPAFAVPYEARALIELGELDQARRLLQPVLLQADLPRPILKSVRAQLIDLYLAQGDYANAKIEAIRYHDEFSPQEPEWYITRAKIEALAGDPAGAGRLLAPIVSIQAKLLQTLFRLQSAEIDAANAQLQIQRQLGRKRISAEERKLAYAIKAAISDRREEGALENRIQALEQYLDIEAGDLHPEIVAFDATDLRAAYLALSDLLINAALMNPGRSSLKFTLAQQSEQADLEIKARALYADVMLDTNDLTLATAAKNRFVQGMVASEQQALLSRLLGLKGVMGDFANIDASTSATLLNYALAKGDADLVSAIAPVLGEPPEGVSEHDWILQKARVDIFAGRFPQAREKLVEWLAQADTLSGDQADRILQAVFDLQAVHQDQIALDLLERINRQTNSKRHKREISYWKAQSFEALDQLAVAAQHYLQSAMAEANGYDQWGQSARYHAALTLMEAEEYFDARRLLEALMSVADDANREATIKQALQRLWLLENQLGTR